MKKMLKSSRAAFLAAGVVCLLVVGFGSVAFGDKVICKTNHIPGFGTIKQCMTESQWASGM